MRIAPAAVNHRSVAASKNWKTGGGQVVYVCGQYGPVFSFTMVGKTFTYLVGSDAAALLFNSKNENLNAEDVYGKLVTPVFGKGVCYDVPHPVRVLRLFHEASRRRGTENTRSLDGTAPQYPSTAETRFTLFCYKLLALANLDF